MKVIALLTEKGGAGKSTLAISLANGLRRAGHSVVIADADTQGTSRDWHALACTVSDPDTLPVVIGADRADSIKSAISSVRSDFVIVDTPAKASKMTAIVLGLTDIALVPIAPSGPDVWAVKPTVEMIEQRIELGANLRAGFVLNRMQQGRALGKEIRSGDWNQYELPILDTVIHEREAFKRSVTEGKSIYDFPGEGKAEIDLLIQEMLEH